MSRSAAPPPEWLRLEARDLYGRDPLAYEAGRPDYPPRVYELISGRCGLRPGARVLEIGPGPGRVTTRLLNWGAHVTAVEPDAAMAAYLMNVGAGKPLDVIVGLFEDVVLPAKSFDLAVAATSFHWVDQTVGLEKLHRALKPRGWAAIWWTIFGDSSRADPFQDAIVRLLPEGAGPRRDTSVPQFELDVEQRRRDLETHGFTDIEVELIRWTASTNASQVRALYASMITILRLNQAEQERILDAVASTAAQDFNGRVERPFVTALYTAYRPA